MVRFMDASEAARAPVRNPQAAAPGRVWITGGGGRYHSGSSCRSLVEGRETAVENGHVPRMGQWVTIDGAERENRTACLTCLGSESAEHPDQEEAELPSAIPRRSDELRIFHVTHVKNLAAIIQDRQLFADANREWEARPLVDISYVETRILRRARPVGDAAGSSVADFVPFSLARSSAILSRSIDGQIDRRLAPTVRELATSSFVRLVTSIHELKEWRREASDSAGHAPSFILARGDAADPTTGFGGKALELVQRGTGPKARPEDIKALVEAEPLVRDRFPFRRVKVIEVNDSAIRDRVRGLVSSLLDPPKVHVLPIGSGPSARP